MKTIEASGLIKSYGGRSALSSLSLGVEDGDVFGFLGPNGAGKTTTIRILTGLLGPDSGEARVAGMDVAAHPRAVKRAVGVLPESQGYYGWMTGEEYLAYFADLYGVPNANGRAREILDKVCLGERGNSLVGGYSRGMRQRLGIARAIVHHPKVLFLDEPSLGLDPKGQREINDLIRHLAREEGVTVFLSSHLLSEIEDLCTRFAIIREGRLTAEGDREELEARLGGGRRIRLEVSEPGRSLDFAHRVTDLEGVRLEAGVLIVEPRTDEAAATLLRLLVGEKVEVYSMQRYAPSLEDIFLRLTDSDCDTQGPEVSS